jgi:hypothetical protein
VPGQGAVSLFKKSTARNFMRVPNKIGGKVFGLISFSFAVTKFGGEGSSDPFSSYFVIGVRAWRRYLRSLWELYLMRAGSLPGQFRFCLSRQDRNCSGVAATLLW